MKKWIIILGISILIIITAIFGTIFIKRKFKDSTNNAEDLIYNNIENDFIETSYSGFKVTPNTKIIFEQKFNKCDHKEIEEEIANEKIVNMNEQELQEYYDDWTVKQFGTEKVVLYKDIDKYCKNHYILKEKDDVIAIFRLLDDDNSELIEKTGILVKYLPETDKINIKNGIKIYGKDELNKWLEDFE